MMIPAATCKLHDNKIFPSPSRSSTIESATERVYQLLDHLSGPNAMASTATQEDATKKPAVSSCKFCKRPSECPSCRTPLDPPTTKDGRVDIDAEIPDTHNQLGGPLDLSSLPAQNANFYDCMPPGDIVETRYSVFLAGSIEMGRAVQWQRHLTSLLRHLPLGVYNPRRGHWNPLATPEAKNQEFRQQVEWELNALEKASVICFFFDHDTMSPVTMCELGLWAASGKVVVCCDRRFWKSGNVHIVCERYGIPCVESFAECVGLVTGMLRRKGMKVDGEGNLTEDEDNEAEGWAAGDSILVTAGLKDMRVKHVELREA
ncbi:hypothetical protein P280DRAFT_445932 [Massarina eburnea CBS 473.64]|uniref:Uncharacterized protein n=1 Tax=Massarina eburnea CBS 473.64 TaxID=1395130 RepID=A0A6A6S9E1_9PLEO|nr:hypothetical protein P280DRAFT_445932 [Massarina eburnea CBS 473.64]